jgi:hypothetical protein
MSAEGTVLRVQDASGRGPYRPGFSRLWSDPDGPIVPLWWEEIGQSLEAAHSAMSEEYHWGCGFRTGEQFRAWFSDRELRKLDRFGFYLVRIAPDVIHAETPSQVVFGTVQPMSIASPRISLVSKLALAA